MAESSGHTLLTETLRVINRAIDAHRDSSPWREIVARTSDEHGPALFAVVVYDGEPEQVVDHYIMRAHEGHFSVVEHGRSGPASDWRVSVAELRRIVAQPDRYLHDPGLLPLGWLETRLGIRVRPKRATGWRIGRVRRPS